MTAFWVLAFWVSAFGCFVSVVIALVAVIRKRRATRPFYWAGGFLVGFIFSIIGGAMSASGSAVVSDHSGGGANSGPTPQRALRPSRSAEAAATSPRPRFVAKTMRTPMPTTTPDTNQDHAKMLKAWRETLQDEGVAMRSLNRAQLQLNAGDVVDASSSLKHCEEAASQIRLDSSSLPDSVTEQTGLIGDGYGYGCKSMRAFLDTNHPSDLADAKEQLSKVPDAISIAPYKMRAEYQRMGGNPDLIRTLKEVDPGAFR